MGRIRTEEFALNMGPQHPSTHGVLRLRLKLDGEIIVECDPDVGFLHRSIEKIAEIQTYQMAMPLTDRLDYVASMYNNFCYALAVEELAGIEVPERAKYIRIIAAELQRLASHLVWLGTFGLDIGALTPFLYCFREREVIMDLFEMICGARLTYNFFRFGGVSFDVPEKFEDETRTFLDTFDARIDEYEGLLTENQIFLERTKEVGIVTAEECVDYGWTGPNLRASGVNWDIRKHQPYAAYEKFDFDVPIGTIGDTWDRYIVRVREMRESARIVRQALDGLPEGEFKVKTPRNLKPAAGDAYVRIEGARGELGFYLVSDGSERPYRWKVRPPSFINLQILPKLLVGKYIADVVAILAGIDIVLGEVDR